MTSKPSRPTRFDNFLMQPGAGNSTVPLSSFPYFVQRLLLYAMLPFYRPTALANTAHPALFCSVPENFWRRDTSSRGTVRMALPCVPTIANSRVFGMPLF